jgi:hypothetical protein
MQRCPWRRTGPPLTNLSSCLSLRVKARRALKALRGLVKLQALVRGNIVRRQAAETLRCMQALVSVQSRARASRVNRSRQAAAHPVIGMESSRTPAGLHAIHGRTGSDDLWLCVCRGRRRRRSTSRGLTMARPGTAVPALSRYSVCHGFILVWISIAMIPDVDSSSFSAGWLVEDAGQ